MAQVGLTGINEFKQHFTSTRPTLFRVSIQKAQGEFFPQFISGKEGDIYFYCKAASLPASNLGEIEVGFMGRKFYEHGDRTFDPWDVTMYNSQDFAMRSFIEYWMDQMNTHENNTQTYTLTPEGGHFSGINLSGNNSSYYGYHLDLRVDQLDRRNNVIYSYMFINAFPTKCGDISLDYTSTDTIEEFPVTFRYQYWQAISPFFGNITDTGKGELTGAELNATGLNV